MKCGMAMALESVFVLVSGCMEMSEEIWINKDASGRLVIKTFVSESLMAFSSDTDGDGPKAELLRIKEELQTDPEIAGVEFYENSEEGMREIVLDIALNRYQYISEVYTSYLSSNDGETDRGSVEFEEIDGGRIRIARLFPDPDESEDVEGEVESSEFAEAGMAMMANMVADKYFTVTLHAPKVEDATGEISPDGTSATWRISFAQLLTEKGFNREIEATVKAKKSLLDKVKGFFD